MTSRGRKIFGGLATLVVIAAGGVVGFWWASPDYDPYTSPAARTFREYGAPTTFSCPESEVLGGVLRAALPDVTVSSTDEEVAASVERVVGAPAFRAGDHVRLLRSAKAAGYRVYGVRGKQAETSRTAVLVGPGNGGLPATSVVPSSAPSDGDSALAVYGVGFCPDGRS